MRVSRCAVVSVAVVAGLVMGTTGASAASSDPNYAHLTSAEVHEITKVSAATLATVGAGTKGQTRPKLVTNQPKLTLHNKPELAYIIAEWCPYCAAESWTVAVSLSRFGTFRGLTTLTSSKSDPEAKSLKTISYRHSRFTSKYLSYDPVVYEDANVKRVDSPSTAVRKAWHRNEPAEGFPFLDIGGKAVMTTSAFDPAVLSGLTRAQIAADLSKPTTTVAQDIDGSANELTAAICLVTHNKPGRVCKSKTITTLRRGLE